MNLLILFIFSFYNLQTIIFTSFANGKESIPNFRLHLSSEPITLDPLLQKGSGATYLMNSLHRPLFKSDLNQKFVPSILENCRWKNQQILNCKLTKELKWSNGEPITSKDVKRTFDYFINKKDILIRRDLIQNIKSINTPNDFEVQFHLEKAEPRFQERLTSPLLAPLYSTQFPKVEEAYKMVTSGPYHIQSWEPKRKIILSPNNPKQLNGRPRPQLTFLIIPEESTALMLYQNGQLDFLRRLPTVYIPLYQSKADFKQAPLVRFDYIGFGPKLEKVPELRSILSKSLPYDDWKKMIHARGRPGCFGIGIDLLKADPCIEFEPSQLTAWKNNLSKNTMSPLTFHYSALGGDDHKRSMEWIQSTWKKNLNFEVHVKGLDNALFQKEMLENPPDLFRFGVSVGHLSCYQTLENFYHSPDRPLPFKNKYLRNIIDELKAFKPESSEEKLCEKALRYLIDEHWIIPLGRIQMTYLLKPQWRGLKITPTNFLDLDDLQF